MGPGGRRWGWRSPPTPRRGPDWTPAEEDEGRRSCGSLIRRSAELELRGERLSALLVAAIARVTTVELLRRCCPIAIRRRL